MPGANKKPPIYETSDDKWALWAQSDLKNWHWLMMHGWMLADEYEKRFKNEHPLKQATRYLADVNNSPSKWMRYNKWSDPPSVLPGRNFTDTVEEYRAYYFTQKPHHNYSLSKPPTWLVKMYTQEVEKLIDAAELALVDPDLHRPNGLTDSIWEDIKFRATEIVNGRMELKDE